MTSAVYSDGFVWKESFLSHIDPRINIAGAAALLAINLISHSVTVSGMIALSMIALMFAGRYPYRRQLVTIAFPVSFALMAIVSQTVVSGQSVFASLGPFDLHTEGLTHGLFLSLRIVAGGLVVVVLGVSTPLSRLCLGLRWFRAPAVFVEVVQLTYRYLFDIYAEFSRMRDAQRARLGWSGRHNGLASSRLLGGSLFLRVYDQGARSAEAMRCRGAGTLITGGLPRLQQLDLRACVVAAGLVSSLIAAALLSRMGVLP